MKFIDFYKAVKEIAGEGVYFSADVGADMHTSGTFEIKYKAYIKDLGYTDDCRNPKEVFKQLRQMKAGTFKKTEKDLEAVGEIGV